MKSRYYVGFLIVASSPILGAMLAAVTALSAPSDDCIDVEVAVSVWDTSGAEMDRDKGIQVWACGVDQPANPVAASKWMHGSRAKAVSVASDGNPVDHGQGPLPHAA